MIEIRMNADERKLFESLKRSIENAKKLGGQAKAASRKPKPKRRKKT
jgi:hypothetical protein